MLNEKNHTNSKFGFVSSPQVHYCNLFLSDIWVTRQGTTSTKKRDQILALLESVVGGVGGGGGGGWYG